MAIVKAAHGAKKRTTRAKSPASRRPGVWVTDEFTGEKFRVVVNGPMPGGKIPIKTLRSAIRKVIAGRKPQKAG